MNKELCSVLKNRLVSLPFIDLLAGMAQTVKTSESNGEVSYQKKFPVAYDAIGKDACLGVEASLIPDSFRKSIIYFEDNGIVMKKRTGKLNQYVSSVRLVCWMNRSNLVGDHYKEISGIAMAAIISKIAEFNPINIGIFTSLTSSVVRILPQDEMIFSRYTYNETERQYLRPPFEFFAIDLSCTYNVHDNCIEQINWNEKIC